MLCENQPTPVSFDRVGNDNKKVKVFALNRDNLPFRQGQYIEMFNMDEPTTTRLAIINTMSLETGELGLDTEVPNNANMMRRLTTYLTQPDYPVQADKKLQMAPKYLIYLDVWERHITHLEDEPIREVALGGPDTATRSKVVWQVKAQELQAVSDCAGQLNPIPVSTALLKAQTEKPEHPATEEPCVLPPEARYRGMEDRLYRVEIHTGNLNEKGEVIGDPPKSFKWSRDERFDDFCDKEHRTGYAGESHAHHVGRGL